MSSGTPTETTEAPEAAPAGDVSVAQQEAVAAGAPSMATDAVLVKSEEMPEGTPTVQGYDFNKGYDLEEVMKAYKFMGFQGTNLGKAIDEVNRMITWRMSDEEWKESDGEDYKDPEVRKRTKCTIWLSYTSNQISAGNREVIRFLLQHKLVDVVVTTAGGIEEDFLKCFAPHFHGDFALPGVGLRKKGINRIGNLLVPNKNYCLFEDWMHPVLNEMHDMQEKEGKIWSPRTMIAHMGKRIDNEESVYYWAQKNDIPVFCPSLTDGSVGDMIFFHSYKRPGFILDIAQDIRGINDIALRCKRSGMLILGGGLVKHHVCNANLFRNGADYSVFINTGQEFDGSDSGARPDEAISWGKIRIDAKPVKVYADATLVFPLLVACTFAKHFHETTAAEAGGAGGAGGEGPEEAASS